MQSQQSEFGNTTFPWIYVENNPQGKYFYKMIQFQKKKKKKVSFFF